MILRGGSEALQTNQVLVQVIREALRGTDLPEEAVQLLASRTGKRRLSDAHARVCGCACSPGWRRLIQTVVQNAQVPVIETGIGNCHHLC